MLMRHGFITAHILCYRDVSLRARLAVSGWVPSISQLFVLLLVTIYWPVRSVSSSNCTIHTCHGNTERFYFYHSYVMGNTSYFVFVGILVGNS